MTEAEYIGSYPSENKCPVSDKPEFAFIGRSNVGKSSLINLILNRNELARTSKKPGKTQYINFYLVKNSWYLVDLPGYGYAVNSKSNRNKWLQMVQGYLRNRQNLICIFLLIDGNVEPQPNDLEFIDWLGVKQLPFVIVYTKMDRLKPEEKMKNIEAFRKEMLNTWEELPTEFISSSRDKTGKNELVDYIAKLCNDYYSL
jgi:GTP-binding protein